MFRQGRKSRSGIDLILRIPVILEKIFFASLAEEWKSFAYFGRKHSKLGEV